MAKVIIGKNEWWPVYVIIENSNREPNANISQELLERYKVNMVEFDTIQDELRTLLENSGDYY